MATMRGERALRQYKRWFKRKYKITNCPVNFTDLDISQPTDLDCMFLTFRNITFKNCNFSKWRHLPHFENCIFENCNFSHSTFRFDMINCSFKKCNFNYVSFAFVKLINIEINESIGKPFFIGAEIENCNLFGQCIGHETNYFKKIEV